MNRKCDRCNVVTMIDTFHGICFDCFCDLDMKAVEEEEFLRFLNEESPGRSESGTLQIPMEEEE